VVGAEAPVPASMVAAVLQIAMVIAWLCCGYRQDTVALKCLSNATAVIYECKMFVKLASGWQRRKVQGGERLGVKVIKLFVGNLQLNILR